MLSADPLPDKLNIDFGVPFGEIYSNDPEVDMEVVKRLDNGQLEKYLEWRWPTDFESGEIIEGWDAAENLYKGDVIVPRFKYLQHVEPLKHCFILKPWRQFFTDLDEFDVVVLFGGNRSSKSTAAAAVILYLAMTVPGFRGVCWVPSDDQGIEVMQKYVWLLMPLAWRDPVRESGKEYSLRFTDQNGFVGNKVILPPVKRGAGSSRILFRSFQSYSQSVGVAQSWNAHFVYIDEMAPVGLIEDMFARVSDLNGRISWGYTTKDGWVPSVAKVTNDASTVEERPAPMLTTGEKVPIRQISTTLDSCAINYWWTEFNTLADNSKLLRNLVKENNRSEILARAYGVVTKAATTKFPLLSRSIHVVKHEDIPFIGQFDEKNPCPPHTVYMVVDPAGGAKNWFVLWAGVMQNCDNLPVVYIFREWPDFRTYGAWAKAGKTKKGKFGRAGRSFGYGYKEYADLFEKIEREFTQPVSPFAISIQGGAITPR